MRETELEVLNQYDIDVKSTRRIRGAILCDTKQGVFVLKEIQISDKRIPALYDLYHHIQNHGYDNVDAILKNKEDACISLSDEGNRFILKRWFCGSECDNRQSSEILEAVRNLARLHKIMQNPLDGVPYVEESKIDEFSRHNREMKKVRSFIRDRVRKNEFEICFLKNFDSMYEWAEVANENLKCSKYTELLERNRSGKYLVHGDYNYHNVLMLDSGIATTNFEHFYEGIQITDFYYFLRKIMEKNHWNIKLGFKMIEEYNKIICLHKEELEYLAVCIAYPEKFWKVANSYYRSRKSWISAKSIEKLEMAIRQTEEKRFFLQSVFPFYK